MRVRPFTWNDLDTYAEIWRKAAAADNGNVAFSAANAEETLRQPNLTPEQDCFFVEVDGTEVGVILVIPEREIGRTVLEGSVRPGFRHRGVGTLLMQTAMKRSLDLGVDKVHCSTSPESPDTKQLFVKAGFVEVRRQWHMRVALGEVIRGSEGSDYTVRHMQEGEEAMMTDLQNEAFSGSFGFAPNVPEEIAYRTRVGGARAEDTLFLYADGRPVAYCWTRRPLPDSADPTGVIWMIGADPEVRGRGFGRAMLLESIDYLDRAGAAAVELTVYQDNAPAVALYRATGFRATGEILWYERRISSPT